MSKRARAWTTAGAIFVTLAGCSSSGSTPRSLATFLLSTGEQPGYSVSGSPTTYATIAQVISGYGLTGTQKVTYENDLSKAGFVRSVGEGLSGSGGLEGFSNVLEFRSAAGARAWTNEALQLAKSEQGSATIQAFTVSGVGSAQGFTAIGNPVATANAFWNDSMCSFGAGLRLPTGSGETPTEIAAPVISGIEAQHAHIGNACP
jgi:hypothetical protein